MRALSTDVVVLPAGEARTCPESECWKKWWGPIWTTKKRHSWKCRLCRRSLRIPGCPPWFWRRHRHRHTILDGDVPRSTSYGVYISQLIRFARVSSHVVDFNARNKSLTAKLLQQGYQYHKLRKTFSKFYGPHYELVSKFNVELKTLLHQGLSEPEFYGDLVYKFKKIVGRVDFSDQFRKIIIRYKRIGYNINIMRQSACLVFNPITVNNFASLFNCTPVGRASDSMMAPT